MNENLDFKLINLSERQDIPLGEQRGESVKSVERMNTTRNMLSEASASSSGKRKQTPLLADLHTLIKEKTHQVNHCESARIYFKKKDLIAVLIDYSLASKKRSKTNSNC